MATKSPRLDEHTPAESTEALLGRMFAGDPDVVRDPYPLYRRLREEAPVHRFGSALAVVPRHADIKGIYADPAGHPSSSSRAIPFDDKLALLTEPQKAIYHEILAFERSYMSRLNGPEHRRVRNAAQRVFTPRRIAEVGDTIQKLTDDVLTDMAQEETSDMMALAYRLPLLALMEIVGAPREDADMLKSLSVGIVEPNMKTPLDAETLDHADRSLRELRSYGAELIERQRASSDRSQLASALLDAEEEDRLSQEELLANIVLLLFAGHETTTNLIGNGVLAMFEHPDQWGRLVADRSLAPRAVEEVLRYDAPVQFITRVMGPDGQIGGAPVAEGTRLVLGNAAGNRDPSVFPDADRFDITRRPNDHLSLGHGAHFCLGGPLARMEGRVVFETLARRFPDMAPGGDLAAIERRTNFNHRGPMTLPVRLGKDRGERAT